MTDIGSTVTPCQAFVGSFGRHGMRDLDFGRQVVECLEELDWPDGVVVEDLSCSAPLVLHRLRELRPAKVVLLGAVGRELDPPATVRRYRVDTTRRTVPPPDVDDVVTELTDLDHMLAMAGRWGGLPAHTVVIEVEPADVEPGLGFSDELAGCFDPILDMVREELADITAGAPLTIDLDADAFAQDGPTTGSASDVGPVRGGPSTGVHDLLTYAEDHAHARRQRHRAPVLLDEAALEAAGVDVAGRMFPWGVFTESGGDWFDAIPLSGGGLALVVGDVAGRGVEVAGAMSDLRAAVRAYAVTNGDSPARMVHDLDRLAVSTGQGRGASVLYVTFQPGTGEIRFANAGGCPPLLVDDASPAGRFLDGARSCPLGAADDAPRPEQSLRPGTAATLLLFTDGLVESATVPRATGLDRLRRAAADGHASNPDGMKGLCEHVLSTCAEALRRDDDICLLGVRLPGVSRPGTSRTATGRPGRAGA